MDFFPVPGLEVAGHRIAPITLIEPSRESTGDAYLVCPDGTQIDLYWRAGAAQKSVVWHPSTTPEGEGVLQVTTSEPVARESDLFGVLLLAVRTVEASLERKARPPPLRATSPRPTEG